jgi:hypothetical protein
MSISPGGDLGQATSVDIGEKAVSVRTPSGFFVSGGNLQQHARTFNASCDIPIALLLPAGHA